MVAPLTFCKRLMIQEKYLHTLEYPKVLAQLTGHTRFSASKELATRLKPTTDFDDAHMLQAETGEARFLLSAKPDIGIGSARDVRQLLSQAGRSIIIMPQELLTIRDTLISARQLRRNVTKLEERVPLLANIAYRLEDAPGVVSDINKAIADDAKIKDSASPELGRIRREIEITHSRLMEKLKRLVSSETYSKYLQESFITQREGRYVIPLKADFKGRIRGVVHDQSSSGATLFVEPIPVVEQNNALRQLQLEEDEEIRRILLAITHAIALESRAISAAIQALAEMDLIFAKARYAEAMRAYEPVMFAWPKQGLAQARIVLRKARHPLLPADEVVPIDMELNEDATMLIITGPNTGGKTVSLKTAGLLALMAQSGLHIPAAEGSGMMVFDGIFADIGDEQSLEQSLSTFSSHMTNIVNILNHCTSKSLVIFDELGAGTDPIEGAALARAILGKLHTEKTMTLVATHYAELKAYAYLTPHVANASMEFNLETLSPTYRLRIGLPGNSNAFAIAGRLGLNNDIIQLAESMVSDEVKETETMLLQIKTELEAARMQRLRLEEELDEAEYYRQKTEDAHTKIDEERQTILNEARDQSRAEIEAVRQEIEALKRQAKAAIAAARLTQQKQQALAAAASKKTPDEKEIDKIDKTLKKMEKSIAPVRPKPKAKSATQTKQTFKVGAKIEVPRFNAKGVITAINKNDIDVQLGHFRTTVKRPDVYLLDNPEEFEETPLKQSSGKGGGMVDSPGLELDLRGQISEEALHRLEGYLDQAFLAGLPFVRIIHGKGSGVLRNVVRTALKEQPLVKSYESGGQHDGGDGVTIARLVKD